jgi:hypothetical protein
MTDGVGSQCRIDRLDLLSVSTTFDDARDLQLNSSTNYPPDKLFLSSLALSTCTIWITVISTMQQQVRRSGFPRGTGSFMVGYMLPMDTHDFRLRNLLHIHDCHDLSALCF